LLVVDKNVILVINSDKNR